MRYSRLTWLLWFCAFEVVNCSAQWRIQQTPTTAPLTDVYFADTLHGWVSGGGVLYHTTDGGDTWNPQLSSPWQISGLSSSELWVTGNRDSIAHTVDGGVRFSWFSLQAFFGFDSFSTIYETKFIDSLHGWVTGEGWINNTLRTKILRTDDGGLSWAVASIPAALNNPTHPIFQFLNPDVGWITGTGAYLYRTSDGATSWDSLGYIGYLDHLEIQFLTPKLGWATTDGPVLSSAVWQTVDSGRTWTSPLSFQFSDATTYVWFADTLRGWVAQHTTVDSSHAEIWHTSDGGMVWNLQFIYAPSFFYRPRKITFVDQYHGWIVGANGIILHTTTGGVTGIPDQRETVPETISLSDNFPNPFNPETGLDLVVRIPSNVQIKIYDVQGREMKTIVDANMPPGLQRIVWDGCNAEGIAVPSGTYFFRMVARSSSGAVRMLVRRMILMR